MIKTPKYIELLKEYPQALQDAWNYKDKGPVLKLDWNEASDNIYGSVIREYLTNNLNDLCLNWYPKEIDEELLSLISEYLMIDRNYIKYCSGSDRALEYVVRTFCENDDKVTIISPTYDYFRIWAGSVGCNIEHVYPRNVFAEDEEIVESIDPSSKLIYLNNPNNPTGWIFGKETVESILRGFEHAILLLDEAYIEYCTDNSLKELTMRYPNLIITRTLSKAWGLAGIRFGYLISDPNTSNNINKIMNHQDISIMTLEIAKLAFKHPSVMMNYVKLINESKILMSQYLEDLNIIDEYKMTPANYCMVKFDGSISEDLHKYLVRNKVYIRKLQHLNKVSEYSRITVGTPEKTRLLHGILWNFKNNRL